MRGDYRRHVDIHVRGGRIAAIVPRGSLPAPGKVVDARDATVIPGLIDVHAHQSALAGERLGRAWLAYGVTTVREIATDVAEAVERGESWANGRRARPAARRDACGGRRRAERSRYRDGGAGARVPRHRRRARPQPARASNGGSGFPTSTSATAHREALALGSGPHYELELSPELASYQDSIGTRDRVAHRAATGLGVAHGPRQPGPIPRSAAGHREPAYPRLVHACRTGRVVGGGARRPRAAAAATNDRAADPRRAEG